jgi:hypothetical protein
LQELVEHSAMSSVYYKEGEFVMPTKAQPVSRPTLRATRNPVESRSYERTIANQVNEQSEDLHTRIAERAYVLYEEHGREDGHALEDWLEAEPQVLDQSL